PLLRRPDRCGGRGGPRHLAPNGRCGLGLRAGLARHRPPRRGLNAVVEENSPISLRDSNASLALEHETPSRLRGLTMSERDICTAARAMTDPAVRAAYLDGACGGDPGLRSRVEALLRAHDQPDSLLDHPAVTPPDPDIDDTHTLRYDGATPAGVDDEVLA